MSGDPQEQIDDSDRLKPCPFCGGNASAGFIGGDGDNAGGHYISCDQCDASTGLRFSCGERHAVHPLYRRSKPQASPLPKDL